MTVPEKIDRPSCVDKRPSVEINMRHLSLNKGATHGYVNADYWARHAVEQRQAARPEAPAEVPHPRCLIRTLRSMGKMCCRFAEVLPAQQLAGSSITSRRMSVTLLDIRIGRVAATACNAHAR